jgi:hypothetical protein
VAARQGTPSRDGDGDCRFLRVFVTSFEREDAQRATRGPPVRARETKK